MNEKPRYEKQKGESRCNGCKAMAGLPTGTQEKKYSHLDFHLYRGIAKIGRIR